RPPPSRPLFPYPTLFRSDPVVRHLATLRVPLGVGSLTIGALVALGVVVAGMWIAHATPFGRTVYAVGGDEASARLMGLPVGRTVDRKSTRLNSSHVKISY